MPIVGPSGTAAGGIPASGAAGQVVGYGGSAGTGSWVYPPGYEINYTQTTSNVTILSTTESAGTSVLSPGALTFDGAAVIVEFFAPLFRCDSAGVGDVAAVSLFESTTQITRLAELVTPLTAAAFEIPVYARYRFTPTAGSHTYTLTAYASSTTGTPILFAGSGGTGGFPPMFVRFTKV